MDAGDHHPTKSNQTPNTVKTTPADRLWGTSFTVERERAQIVN